jgi:hypothetical protein
MRAQSRGVVENDNSPPRANCNSHSVPLPGAFQVQLYPEAVTKRARGASPVAVKT